MALRRGEFVSFGRTFRGFGGLLFRLGGFNGMPAVPTFNLPYLPDLVLSPEQSWWATGGALLAIYLLMRLLLLSPFGRIAIAVRENEVRASLLGYDPRLVKLGVFVIGGAVAVELCASRYQTLRDPDRWNRRCAAEPRLGFCGWRTGGMLA